MRTVVAGLIVLAAAAVTFASDPFADVKPSPVTVPAAESHPSWKDNLLFRSEIYWMTTLGADDFEGTHDVYSRVSAGFEVQKRFSTATRTVAAIDYQGRVVYRDHKLNTAADSMGMNAARWEYETHNAYAEFYNVLGEPGRLSIRAGRFYIPFGLNYLTDTHGTLLQLSNDRVFGTERDWQVVAYGEVTRLLAYSAGYVFGAGPDQALDGQAGMAVGRLGLGNTALFEHGLEGGLSVARGERLDPHVEQEGAIRTWRAGADARKRFDTSLGPFTLAGEVAGGEDDAMSVWSGLAQAEWSHPGRRWGAALQYFRFALESDGEEHEDVVDERVSLVLTSYFRNDVGSAALHWIALGIEQQISVTDLDEETLLTLQYYKYW